MSVTRETSDKLSKRLAALAPEIKQKIIPALIRGAEEVARDARALAEASRDTGGLIDSIHVTKPGETTPPYSQGGGTAQAHELQALITVGDPENRHGHLVEFGADGERVIKTGPKAGVDTGTMKAKPFLLPSWRLNRTRVERRIQRAIRAGIKAAASAGGGTDVQP